MAKNNNKTKEEPLENQLWKAADKLRKNIDAAEYKHIVLGLIFLKYISDAFEGLYQELQKGEEDYAGADPEDRDEYKAENDQKFEQIFNAIEKRSIKPKQGIFFDGQIFDAYQFVCNLIRTARNTILIIDNYIDDTVLTYLTKRNKSVKVTILTKTISNQMALDVKKYNEQYPAIEIKEFKNSHDLFMIIDNTTVYHFGASLKDLGKKLFAFSKMDIGAVEMLARFEGMKVYG